MKKVIFCAIVLLAGCYTPLNNSGVATTKPWIEIPAKRVDFDGKQYDSCVQLNLRFWPQEAAQRLDLAASCISACCWRSEKDEIVLDFNKNFEEELLHYGVARKYVPGEITLKVTHSNLVNVTKVTTDPRGIINNSGLVTLSYITVRDEARLAQIEQELAPEDAPVFEEISGAVSVPPVVKTNSTPSVPVKTDTRAKELAQRKAGAQIDDYFYQMNKTYRAQNAVFILSTRLFSARLQADGTYLVTCHAKARTGLDEKHLNTSDFPCGVWLVDLATELVLPDDKKARQILGQP